MSGRCSFPGNDEPQTRAHRSAGALYFQYMGCVDRADYDNDGDLNATVTRMYMGPPSPNANKTFAGVNGGAGMLDAVPAELPQGANFSAVGWSEWDANGDLAGRCRSRSAAARRSCSATHSRS